MLFNIYSTIAEITAMPATKNDTICNPVANIAKLIPSSLMTNL